MTGREALQAWLDSTAWVLESDYGVSPSAMRAKPAEHAAAEPVPEWWAVVDLEWSAQEVPW